MINKPSTFESIDVQGLEERVLGTPGITDLYPHLPSIKDASGLLRGSSNLGDRVRVTHDHGAIRVSARISAHPSAPAPETAAHAADAILATLPPNPQLKVEIEIEICRIA